MSMSVCRFAAPWSLATWVTTLFVVLLVIVVSGVLLTQAEKVGPEHASQRVLLIVAAMIVPLILMTLVAFAPLGFTVDEIGVVVNRIGPKVCILHSEIDEICRLKRGDIGIAIRVCGSGGFLGCFGKFWSRGLGKYRGYVTNGKDLVLIRCRDGRQFVLSPCPPDTFVQLVEQARC